MHATMHMRVHSGRFHAILRDREIKAKRIIFAGYLSYLIIPLISIVIRVIRSNLLQQGKYTASLREEDSKHAP